MALRRGVSGVANDDLVMGRYAYNLYDISGALDINAAGFPGTGGPEAGLAASKGSLAFADRPGSSVHDPRCVGTPAIREVFDDTSSVLQKGTTVCSLGR